MAKPKQNKYRMREEAGEKGKQEAQGKKGGGTLDIGDKKYWRPTKRVHHIQVIPYIISKAGHPSGFEEGDLYQQLKIKMHFGVGPEERTLLCPTTFNKPCPLCERFASLRKSGSADEEELNEVKAKDRVAFNIIDLDDEDAGIQVFEYSTHLFANMLYDEIDMAAEDDPDFRGKQVFDPVDGYDLTLKFKEKKFGKNSFFECTSIAFEDRDQPISDADIEDAIDLHAAANVMDYKAVEAIWLGVGGEAEAKDEEEEKPRSHRREPAKEEKPAGRRKPTPEPDEEEEEEPKEKPATSRRRAKPEPEPDEEEEEEAPAKGKKAAKDADDDCPYGLEFGADCESEDKCDDCDAWEACRDKLDEIEAAKKAAGGKRRK